MARSTLRQGSRGEEVRYLQERLRALGFDPGPSDGVFGPKTADAVRRYQQSRGLAADGIVGPKTWGAIEGGPAPAGQAAGARPGAGGPAPQDANAWQDAVRAKWPEWGFAINDPELGPLFKEANEKNWSWPELLARIVQSNFWKTRASEAIRWQGLSPGEQAQQIDNVYAQLEAQLRTLYGTQKFNQLFPLNVEGGRQNGRIRHEAYLAVSGQKPFGIIQLEFANEARITPGTQSFVDEQIKQEELARRAKRPEEIAEELWQTARLKYWVPLSKDDAKRFANGIINGTFSMGEFMDNLRAQSKVLYPAFSERIDAGITPQTLFAPYMNAAADELEQSPETIVLNDKIFGTVLQGSATGTFPSLTDFIAGIRRMPEWQRTKKAQDIGYDLGARFARAFGVAV